MRFKIARRDGRMLNAAPEFDDCARLAAAHGLPVKDVQALAVERLRPVPADASREPFLPHHRDRLRQQPPAPRHGVREDHGRRHRALPAAAAASRPVS